jgi:hypothetical protein
MFPTRCYPLRIFPIRAFPRGLGAVVPPPTRPRMPNASTAAGRGPDPAWSYAVPRSGALDSTAAGRGLDSRWSYAVPDEGV